MLKLTDVHAFIGLHHILHGISFDVAPGEIVALLGRNGVGKTTTLRSIMGLVETRQGDIAYDGTSLVGMAPHRINRMGISYVPEYRGIFSDLSVAENLNISALRASEWQISDVLELFPVLKELLNRKGGNLSGGEQQMLAIARALLGSPRILLLDEPSQGLAPLIVDTVVETIQALKAQSLGVVLVEQNAEIALGLANRVCIIDQGRIVFQGGAEELKASSDIIATHLGVG